MSDLNLRNLIHRSLYKLHFLVPKGFIWSKLHASDYHPGTHGIVARIETARKNPAEYSLIQFWSKHLGVDLIVSGKDVLEIGHGGGWYLAEMLDAGSRKVFGLEISTELNLRATQALAQTGYSNFQLVTGSGNDLSALRNSTFDFIYANTVVQHLSTHTLEKYLRDIASLLNAEGLCVLQVLQTRSLLSRKRFSRSDLFSVAYTASEFKSLLLKYGFSLKHYAEIEYGGEDDFWGLYVFNQKS
jgi:cyclopropane fatty-acyl-phospholipid synthase-like methyltransferase